MSRLLIAVLSGCLLLVGVAAGAAGPALPDTRILIDISGSMKKNDPKNLRRPALRLLVGLLPSDSRAGVWTFGQYVNMQIPLGTVDENWRRRARGGADKIHSRGLFTNIEEALIDATEGWVGREGEHQRHVVLLTDGMVDVSKDPAESLRSRARIMDSLLPRLQEMNVRIHTVALSERADHELMRKLSESSGGWYEQVENASELQKVFLRIFEKVGNPDTVPLKDNRFKIDDSIREVTLIVFRAEGAEATRVTAPNGQSFDRAGAPGNVSWHQDEGYDLLTIREPLAGDWSIQAALDPDNRVMILTDLRMQVSELPNYVVAGQRVPASVGFLDQGKPLSRREFIDVVGVSAEQVGPKGLETEPRPLRDDGNGEDPLAYDGNFEFRFSPEGEDGRAELVISAEGVTFQREKRIIFELRQPAMATVQPESDKLAVLRVSPVAEVIDPASMEVTADLAKSDGSHEAVVLERGADGVFAGRIDVSTFAGEAVLEVRVRARTAGGDTVGAVLPAQAVRGSLPLEAPASAPAAAASPVDAVEPEPEGDDSNQWLIWFGVANVVVLLLGGLVFWLIRRRAAKDPFQLVDEDDEPSSTQAQEPKGDKVEEAA